jgi:hypothetical protein
MTIANGTFRMDKPQIICPSQFWFGPSGQSRNAPPDRKPRCVEADPVMRADSLPFPRRVLMTAFLVTQQNDESDASLVCLPSLPWSVHSTYNKTMRRKGATLM